MKRWFDRYKIIGNSSFFFNKKLIVYAFSIITITIIILDFLNNGLTESNAIYNYLNILLVLVVTVLFKTKKILIDNAINIVVYAAILDLIISHIIKQPDYPNYSSHFLRTTIMMGMIVPILAMANGIKHLFIIGIMYLIFLIIIVVKSQNIFLIENLGVLILITLSYCYGIFYIINELEKDHKIQLKYSERLSEANSQLMLKNRDLERLNQILEQKNQKIEDQSKELQQLINTRDRLYSIISHDLRNSLGAIKGFSELMHNHSITINDQKLSRFSHNIMISAKRTYELLSNLLDWTRIQTGAIKVKYETFVFHQLLVEIIDLYTVAINAKKIDFIYEKKESIKISADKNMIQMITRNIISNAIKFTPVNGQININYNLNDDIFVCTIKDTGMGMSEVDKNGLFTFNGNSSKPGTEGEKGSGLGLLLCLDFIKLHKGEIIVNSEKDKGSEFTYIIPARKID
jgi:signal transduction histidine kinase